MLRLNAMRRLYPIFGIRGPVERTSTSGQATRRNGFASIAQMTGRRTFIKQLGLLSALPAATRHVLASPARQTQTDPWPSLMADLPAILKSHHVPGLAMAVVVDGKLRHSIGVGVKRAGNGDPVTDRTVFEVASLSKPPFAWLVHSLAADGTLAMDARLGAFFREPDFVSDARVDTITPAMVLTHRTGLLNWRPAREPQRFQFTPGEGFSYSGEAYVRLQRFVEQRTNASLDTLAARRLFAPWDMPDSSYIWRPEFEQVAAEGHDANGGVRRTRLWQYNPSSPEALKRAGGPDIPLFAVPNAAASLYASARDYGRFLERLLASPLLPAMVTPAVRVTADIDWGSGWALSRVNGVDTFWHWGNNDVYRSFVVGARDRRWATVILTNSAHGLKASRDIVSRLLGADHPAFRWPMVLPQ